MTNGDKPKRSRRRKSGIVDDALHAVKRTETERAKAESVHPDFTAPVKLKFLEWLRKGYSVTKACEQVGISPRQAYTHRNAYGEFADQWDDAIESGADLLEDVAVQRAIEGISRPIYQQGIRVGEERTFNENLLMFLLKGKKPEKYRERHDLTSGGDNLVQGFARALMELPKYGSPKPSKKD